MYPLIEIKTIPIEIRMKMTNAKLEYTSDSYQMEISRSGTAEMEISRSDKGIDIKSRPIRLPFDSFETRNAQNLTSANGTALANWQGSYEATSVSSSQQEGIMFNAHFALGLMREQEMQAIHARQTRQQNAEPRAQSESAPAEGHGVNYEWEDGELQIRYDLDKLNIDWRFDEGEVKFTPPDLEVSVEQLNRVVVKWVGEPLYVPPSANPNYEPLDVKV